jgi:hypothetical protein
VSLHPRPAEIGTIYPDWRGFDFILVNKQIVVIDPRTCEIVSVIEAGLPVQARDGLYTPSPFCARLFAFRPALGSRAPPLPTLVNERFLQFRRGFLRTG